MPKLIPFLYCLGSLTGNYLHAQQTDTLRLRMSHLLARYRGHSITDTEYLKGVDSIAPMLGKEDSISQLLSVYQQLAFAEPSRGKYRAGYYTYLAMNAYNSSRLGSAIYYSEKNNEERTKLGQFEKGAFTHSDWFALTVYANNHNYQRVFTKYAALRPALEALPAGIMTGNVSPEQVFVAISILQTVNYAACRSGDTARASEVIYTMNEILMDVGHFPAKYKDYRLQYDYLLHSMYYEYHRMLNQLNAARDSLMAAIRDVNTKGFRPDLQAAYAESLYSEAVDLYFKMNKTDSARHYLSLLTEGDGKVRYSSLDASFLSEAKSRLLAGERRWAEAYAELHTVYGMRDSAYYTVSADKDNNLYALAEAENTRLELLRSEEQKRAAERSSISLFFILTILVLGGVTGFMVYRSGQERRILNLRLQLARNFHDEIGPMLLYANVLAKKQQNEELRGQIGLIMDAVRNIAHDLKSPELNTIASLGKVISNLLKKVQAATDIDFLLQAGNGTRVLSHGQFTQLQAIIQELISNSIKHADCNKIMLRIAAPEQRLTVSYSDDGRGIGPGAGSTSGIGIRNIEERAALLRGSFQLNDAWPNGYSIEISIPLV
jgi:signal transduction histidine kinase